MRKRKLLFWISLIILSIYSVLNIYNAKLLDYYYKDYYIKQCIWLIISILIILVIRKIKIHKLFNISFIFYIVTLLSLLLVLFIGIKINGSKAWFNFKFFSFQPSEVMRLSLTIFLCEFTFIFNFKKYKEIIYIILVFIFTLIPSILVFLEPDTGAIIFYFIITISILWSSPINKKWFLLFLLLIIIIISIFCYFYFYKEDLFIKLFGTSIFYRIDRLINFYHSIGFQIENALITISNASLLGTGIGKILIYIPEGLTDFIFAFSIGNFGILSGVIILICYIIIDITLLLQKEKIKDFRYQLFSNAFIGVFLFQQIYNILMNLNLLPIMGIPLPFLSYGGSTMLVYSIIIGLFWQMDYLR